MSSDCIARGLDRYYHAIQTLQTSVIERQRDQLVEIARVMANTIVRDQRIFLFGTGHSHLLAEEGHFRAGGLANVVPMLASAVMMHESAVWSGCVERTLGLARPLFERYQPCAGEMLFVFSNSGVNAMPVEMALIAREQGLTTVAVCSLAYARVAPLSSLGQRLFEVTAFVVDNGGEPGDSLIALEGSPWRAGPSSTVIGALIWNALSTAAACQVQEQTGEAPVWASGNLPGAAAHNAKLLSRWQTRNPHL